MKERVTSSAESRSFASPSPLPSPARGEGVGACRSSRDTFFYPWSYFAFVMENAFSNLSRSVSAFSPFRPLPSREKVVERGRRVGAQHLFDFLKDASGIREHLVVPESNHPESTGFQPTRPLRIRLSLVSVLPTIKFNYQLGRVTNEIHDVQPKWLLAFELEASETMRSYLAPQNALRIRHVAAQALGGSGEKATASLFHAPSCKGRASSCLSIFA